MFLNVRMSLSKTKSTSNLMHCCIYLLDEVNKLTSMFAYQGNDIYIQMCAIILNRLSNCQRLYVDNVGKMLISCPGSSY